jgi:aminopeptidase N
VIELDFQVAVPAEAAGYGQFILERDIMALANFFPLIPAFDLENCALYDDCDGGWNIEYPVPYGDAVFSETAFFDVRVTAPADWTVVASGSTVGQETDAAGDVTWHIVSGPTRDLNVVLSSRFQVASKEIDGTVVNSYYLPEHETGGKYALGWGATAIGFFSEQFGPYPFAEFDIVETPNIAGGIEYPGLIAMPIHSYEQISGFFEWATVHEVSHQWWYSVVGNDQQDEPWLDEALAQYSTALYYESVEEWADAVDEVLRGYYEPVAGTEQDKSFALPVKDYTESTYGPLVYGKGPLFLHAIREEVGLEAFYHILETYYSTYRYQVASGEDWLVLANQVTEEDLTPLYKEWIPEAAASQ